METLDEFGLRNLHRGLMLAVRRRGVARVPPNLAREIDALGWVTQEYLVNAAEPNGLKQTPLVAACLSSIRVKRRIIDTLLRWAGAPSCEFFDFLIGSTKLEGRHELIRDLLVKHSTKLMTEYVFLTACSLSDRSTVSICLDVNVAFVHLLNADEEYLSLYSSQIINVLEDIVCRGDMDLLKILKPCIIKLCSDHKAIHETLMLTAAFRLHEHVVEYLMSVVSVSTEAQGRVYEALGASYILVERRSEGAAAWAKTEEITKRAVRVFNGDIAYHRDPLEMTDENCVYVKALSIIEKHYKSMPQFFKALLLRPYTIRICIYTLNEFLYTRKVTQRNLQRIQDHLEKAGFLQPRSAQLVMLCIEWCMTAIDYIPDKEETSPGLPAPYEPPCEEEDYEEEEDKKREKEKLNDYFGEVEKRFKDSQRVSVRFATHSDLVEFACWILLRLEWCKDFDTGRDWYKHLLKRLVSVSYRKAGRSSLLHRLLQMRLERPGPRNIFEILIWAGVDLNWVDAEGNTLLHAAVDAQRQNLSVSREFIESLIEAGVSANAVNDRGFSVEHIVFPRQQYHRRHTRAQERPIYSRAETNQWYAKGHSAREP